MIVCIVDIEVHLVLAIAGEESTQVQIPHQENLPSIYRSADDASERLHFVFRAAVDHCQAPEVTSEGSLSDTEK